ncbi:MAG: hypothetical protein ACM33T_02735 [Solirubrobacterales bacterium]
MVRMTFRTIPGAALALVLAAAFAAPASAEEAGDFLGSIGSFVKQGLAPPRTAEELLREEDKARLAPKPAVERPVAPAAPAVQAAPAHPPAPAAVAEPVPAEPPAAEPKAAPASITAPAAAPVTPPRPAPSHPAVPPPPAEPAVSAPAPIPAPIPAPPPKPRQIQVAPQPKPEPVSPADRIAGTATLDQAVKLGGPADLYGRRSSKPAN